MNKLVLRHAIAAIAVVACMFSAACSREGNISVAADNSDILYMGRIHWSDSATAVFNYPGVTAILNFFAVKPHTDGRDDDGKNDGVDELLLVYLALAFAEDSLNVLLVIGFGLAETEVSHWIMPVKMVGLNFRGRPRSPRSLCRNSGWRCRGDKFGEKPVTLIAEGEKTLAAEDVGVVFPHTGEVVVLADAVDVGILAEVEIGL